VKEQILKYLQEAGKGVSAAQILADVLRIRSPNDHSSESILAGLLCQDPRFVFAAGLWRLRPPSVSVPEWDDSRIVVLHLQTADNSATLRHFRGAARWADGHLKEFASLASISIFSRLRDEIEGHLLIAWSGRELGLWNVLMRSMRLEVWRGDTLFLRNLAARALERVPSKLQPEDMAPLLGLSPADEERPREVVEYMSACWRILRQRVPAEFCRTLDSLREWIDNRGSAVDFSHFAFGPDFLRQLPRSAGVYIMTNREGKIIYVGKSRNLRRRVSSYFTPQARNDPKIGRIHERLHSIDVCTTENEIEALLMEMRLIKDFRPAINLQTEIHENMAGQTEGRNLILFVADEEQKRVEVYLFRNGSFAGRQSAPMGRLPSKRLQERIRSIFFAQGRTRKRKGETWEKEIVSRWFNANRKRMNYLDVDEAGDLTRVQEQLTRYLCDPDKLAHKVYYR